MHEYLCIYIAFNNRTFNKIKFFNICLFWLNLKLYSLLIYLLPYCINLNSLTSNTFIHI